MKKLTLQIKKHTKAFIIAASIFGLSIAAGHKLNITAHKAGTTFAFVGLVAGLKKRGSYDKLDEGTKTFVDEFDAILTDFATDAIDKKGLDEILGKRLEENGTGLTKEEKQQFSDAMLSVKKHAEEIEKMKDAGFTAQKVLPFGAALQKALHENEAKFKALKSSRKGKDFFDIEFKAASIMGMGNVAAAAPFLPTPQIDYSIHEAPLNEPFILDYTDTQSTSSPVIIWFNKVNREDGTAWIEEGELKPLSDFELEKETMSASKVATAFNVSEEMLSDLPFIEGEIRSEGVTNVRMKIDDGILNGDGIGENPKGILSYTTSYALTGLNNSVDNASLYDALIAGYTQLTVLNNKPNLIAVNPIDHAKMRLTKDTTGQYIIPPTANADQSNISGLPLIAKNQIPQGKFLMADMRKSHVKVLMDITIKVGLNEDDFRKNRVTFLVEARLYHYISDVEKSAFLLGDFAAIQAALETA